MLKTRTVLGHTMLLLLAVGVVGAQEGRFEDLRPIHTVNSTVNSPWWELQPNISADGLSLYFASSRPGRGDYDLYVATRDNRDAPFEQVEPLDELNTRYRDISPSISSDGLVLYFTSNRPGGMGDQDLYLARRDGTVDDEGNRVPFGPAELVDGVNTRYWDCCPSISADGLALYFDSTRPGGRGDRDLYVGVRSEPRGPFETGRPLENINTPFTDASPSISSDGMTLFWSDNNVSLRRPGGRGGVDIWFSFRQEPGDSIDARSAFDDALNLESVNATAHEWHPDVSSDWPARGAKLYFVYCIGRGDCDIYDATWVPLAFRRSDCNDDGAVDISDAVCILNWLFLGGMVPGCIAVTNTNGDADADISDATYLLNHLFLGGPAPVDPFPECGPGTLALGCVTPPKGCQ